MAVPFPDVFFWSSGTEGRGKYFVIVSMMELYSAV